MALSGNAITNDYNGRYYKFEWTCTQDIATNKTKVTWELGAYGGSAEWYAERTLKLTVNGTELVSKTNRVERYTGKISGGSFTLTHDSSGNRTFTVDIQAAVYVTEVNLTRNKTFTLNTIPRAATLTSAPNFTSADSPKIVYSNPAGNSVTSLEACISLDGSKADIPYRSIPKTGTEYTFNLTTAEKNTLLNATTSGNSRSVKFFIKTVIGGETFYSQLTKTFSISSSSSAPTITGTVYDSNSTTTKLTGDSSKLIKGYSNAYFSIGASAATGASITSQSCTNGSYKSTSSTGTFNGVTSGSFVFSVKDSRGNVASKTVTKTVIDYFKPTVDIEQYLNTDGELSISISGTFFNNSFGAYNNNITCYLAVWDLEEDMPATTAVTANISGDNFTYTTTRTGLDYRKRYGIYFIVQDKLANAYVDISTTSEPVFDWGKDDFNVNVPFKMEGATTLRKSDKNIVLAGDGGHIYLRPNGDENTDGELIIKSNGDIETDGVITTQDAIISYNSLQAPVISGGYVQSNQGITCKGYLKFGDVFMGDMTILHTDSGRFMHESHSISLTGTNRITKQINGYICVWYLYLDGTMYSSNINYTFIPKHIVNMPSKNITMVVGAEDAGNIGCKTLFVEDNGTTTTIKGHTANDDSTHNNKWVLRYIIGW